MSVVITNMSGGVTGIPPNPALVATSNYLWELMGRYGVQALKYTGGSTGGGSVAPPSSVSNYVYTELPIDVSSGYPVSGTNIYQNDDLKFGKNLQFIILDNGVYSVNIDFAFNPVSGTITLLNNTWTDTNKGTIPFSKKITV